MFSTKARSHSSRSTSNRGTETQLAPSYILPFVLILGSIPVWTLQSAIGIFMVVLGVFLGIQATVIRVVFTTTAMELYRSQTLIRQFLYADWQNWRLFWSGLPILLYFKEVKSIHFMPILFDATELERCLTQYCQRQ